MNDRERQQLKERLQLLANAPPGLRFETPELWAVSGIKEPRAFFQNLPLLMPLDSVLYLEGISIHPEAATLYSKHETAHPAQLDCGTIFPVPDFYHLSFSAELVTGLLDLITRRPANELFHHASGYQPKSLIFSFHDAFENDLHISGSTPEPIVGEFCSTLGASFARTTIPKPTNPYNSLLNLLEHPEKIKISRAPWWREAWEGFKSGFRKG